MVCEEYSFDTVVKTFEKEVVMIDRKQMMENKIKNTNIVKDSFIMFSELEVN